MAIPCGRRKLPSEISPTFFPAARSTIDTVLPPVPGFSDPHGAVIGGECVTPVRRNDDFVRVLADRDGGLHLTRWRVETQRVGALVKDQQRRIGAEDDGSAQQHRGAQFFHRPRLPFRPERARCGMNRGMPARAFACLMLFAVSIAAQTRIRARDLGVPFTGTPGPTNSIVDVAGVTVGHTTLVQGSDVRTGVTAVWPRGKATNDPVFAGWWSLNGNGEMTGTTWIEESGFLDGPVILTNTHSVGVARDAFIRWQVRNKRTPGTNVVGSGAFWSMPVVAETFDGFLNDTNGFHVKPEHVEQALESAEAPLPAEGSVGGGTGMVCFGFKGGIGTSSRRAGAYTVGALVQCNCGRREELRIAGIPVTEAKTVAFHPDQPGITQERGSIIIVVATDAPLLPHQMKRLARRAGLGLARMGATSSNYSGDIFVAFSTANPKTAAAAQETPVTMLANQALDPIFSAVVGAVEEAITNALVGATTVTGYQGHKVEALPHEAIQDALRRHAITSR